MFDTYVVDTNDTIESIANKFNTSPNVIKEINDNNIMPGNTIMIPKITNNIFDYYRVNKGDTLYKIATDNNINPSLLAELNGLNIDDYIYPNQILLIPKAGTILYITASGDTLLELAKGLNIDIMDLINQNKKIYLQPEQLIVYKYK